jgi:hypothetical protein
MSAVSYLAFARQQPAGLEPLQSHHVVPLHVDVVASSIAPPAEPISPRNGSCNCCCLTRIWNAVCDFFRRLFCCEPKVELIDKILARNCKRKAEQPVIPVKTTPLVAPSQSDRKEQDEKSLSASEPKTPRKVAPKYPAIEPVVQQLGQVEADLLFEYCKEPLKKIQETYAADVPNMVQTAVSIAVPICSQGFKRLWDKMKTTSEETLPPPLVKALNWLLKGQLASPEAKEALRKGIIAKLAASESFAKEFQQLDLSKYIGHILTWLEQIEKKPISIEKMCTENGLHLPICIKLYDEIFKHLFDVKFKEIHTKLSSILGENLPTIVQSALRKNFTKMSAFVADRAMALADKMAFTETFDGAIDTFNKQVDEQLKAREKAKAHIEKVKKSGPTGVLADAHAKMISMGEPAYLQRTILNGYHDEAEEEAEAFVQKVKDGTLPPREGVLQTLKAELVRMGEAAFKEKAISDRYMKKQGYQFHPQVKKFLYKAASVEADQKKSYDESMSDALTKSMSPSSKDGYFIDLAKTLIDLMAPKEEVRDEDGTTRKMGGIELLMNQLEIPDEVKNVIQYLKEMGVGIFDDKVNAGINFAVRLCLLPTIEKYVLEMLHELVVFHLSQVLEQQFKEITLKSKLDDLMAFQILPPLRKLLVDVFSMQGLAQKTKEIAPLFLKLISDAPANALIGINEAWFEITQKYQKESKIDKKEFMEITAPRIEQMKAYLLDYRTRMRAQQPTFQLNDEKVAALLKEFLTAKEDHYPVDGHEAEYDLYWNLFEKAAFGLGNLKEVSGVAEWGLGKIKHIIIGALLNGMHKARTSPDELTGLISKSMMENYGNRDGLKQMVLGPHPVRTPETTRPEMDKQFLQIAQLINDLVKRSVGETSNIVVSKLVNKKLKLQILHERLAMIYRKGFENSIFNANLMLKIFELARNSLTEAAGRVSETHKIILSEVQRLAREVIRNHEVRDDQVLRIAIPQIKEQLLKSMVEACRRFEPGFFEKNKFEIEEIIADAVKKNVKELRTQELLRHVDMLDKDIRFLGVTAVAITSAVTGFAAASSAAGITVPPSASLVAAAPPALDAIGVD